MLFAGFLAGFDIVVSVVSVGRMYDHSLEMLNVVSFGSCTMFWRFNYSTTCTNGVFGVEGRGRGGTS